MHKKKEVILINLGMGRGYCVLIFYIKKNLFVHSKLIKVILLFYLYHNCFLLKIFVCQIKVNDAIHFISNALNRDHPYFLTDHRVGFAIF